jgi:phosphomannomutase
VRVADRQAVDKPTAVWRSVAEEEARLGDKGRVLVRPSGTEALVRVMVEAQTEQEARATADRLAAVVGGRAGLTPARPARARLRGPLRPPQRYRARCPR